MREIRFSLKPPMPMDITHEHGRAMYLGQWTHGKIDGAFAWTGFTSDSCQMHYAGAHPRWMNRQFLEEAFTYPFIQLGVKVVLAFLPEEKLHARDVAIKLGFKQMGLIPGIRVWMLTMVREDCRWIHG